MSYLLMRALGSVLLASALILLILLVSVSVTNGLDLARDTLRTRAFAARRDPFPGLESATAPQATSMFAEELDQWSAPVVEEGFQVTRELVQAIDEEILVCAPY